MPRAVAKDVRPRGADTNQRQTEDSPNICMYNWPENISSGADRGPNEGGLDEGERDISISDFSEEEDSGLN